MGNYTAFPSQTPQVRPKPPIYTPRRDEEHTRHFYMEVPPYGVRLSIANKQRFCQYFDCLRSVLSLKTGPVLFPADAFTKQRRFALFCRGSRLTCSCSS